MEPLVCVNIDNQYLHFSAAHFTIFSATSRERLHGHNFSVQARVYTPVLSNGMAFDYAVLKKAVFEICQKLDEYTLIPQRSEFLEISEQDPYFIVNFNTEKMMLLKSDTLLLPLANITLEELGRYFLDCLDADNWLEKLGIVRMELDVASGPGQRVTTEWRNAGMA